MYNVKIKNYGNGQIQTRIYSHLIYTGDKEKPEKEELENNPFDNQPVKEDFAFDELEKERVKKAEERGGFGEKVFLREVCKWVLIFVKDNEMWVYILSLNWSLKYHVENYW